MNTGALGIAIPSFEQGEHVTQALASVRTLSIPFTAIVQDAGSSPATLERIEDAIGGDDRMRLVVEKDQGQADAINRAWTKLIDQHPYLTWVNTDDVLYPEGVAAAVAALEASDGSAMTYGDVDVIDERGRTIGSLRGPPRVARFRLVHHNNVVPGIVPIIRADAVKRVGMMDVRLDFALDLDLFIRLASVGSLRRVPVKVGAQRLHAGAKTVKDRPGFSAEIAAVRERYRQLPRPVAEALRFALRLAWVPARRRYVRTTWRLER